MLVMLVMLVIALTAERGKRGLFMIIFVGKEGASWTICTTLSDAWLPSVLSNVLCLRWGNVDCEWLEGLRAWKSRKAGIGRRLFTTAHF